MLNLLFMFSLYKLDGSMCPILLSQTVLAHDFKKSGSVLFFFFKFLFFCFTLAHMVGDFCYIVTVIVKVKLMALRPHSTARVIVGQALRIPT